MAIKLTHESRSAISRARLFLEKAKMCPVDARVDFEAFLESVIVFSRAAMHRLQSRHEKHAQWEGMVEWVAGRPGRGVFSDRARLDPEGGFSQDRPENLCRECWQYGALVRPSYRR